jgi:hypothetical protein
VETRSPPPGARYLLRDCYQTPTNSKETYTGDHGHLGPTPSGESLPRRNSNLDPPYHVYNRTRRPKIHRENTHHQRSPKGSKTDHRTILEIIRMDEFTSQQGFSRERPITGLLYRNRGMARESTIRAHLFHRHRKTNIKPHSRGLPNYSSGDAFRHKAYIEPRHTTVMVDRDTHGRIMEGGAIPKWGPPNTIGTGVTNSMASPHGSPRTRPKDDR